jgi:UDP-2,3-diacylglucosamine hydrolase
MQAWFVSDIHIKSLNERNSIHLLRFLHFLSTPQAKATHLFLLGDIFDVWIGDSDVFYRKFKDIIDAILALKNAGIEVIYFEGNHDLHMQKFWQRFDIPCYTEEKYFQLGKWTVRAEHGDLINPHDAAYLRYRDFVRKPHMQKLAYRVSGYFWDWFGARASKKSRMYSGKQRASREVELREIIRSHAERSFQQQGFDFIITGHMHIKDEYTLKNTDKNAVSINLGSWFDQPQVLVLSEEGCRWLGTGELP